MDVDESKLGTPTITNRRNSVWLVVEPTPLQTMKVSWDDCSQYMEQKKCLKPPASIPYIGNNHWVCYNVLEYIPLK